MNFVTFLYRIIELHEKCGQPKPENQRFFRLFGLICFLLYSFLLRTLVWALSIQDHFPLIKTKKKKITKSIPESNPFWKCTHTNTRWPNSNDDGAGSIATNKTKMSKQLIMNSSCVCVRVCGMLGGGRGGVSARMQFYESKISFAKRWIYRRTQATARHRIETLTHMYIDKCAMQASNQQTAE